MNHTIKKSWAKVRQSVSRMVARNNTLSAASETRHTKKNQQQGKKPATTGFQVFAREMLNNPREIGAACPSSPKLGRMMAAQVPKDSNGFIVELGAGTGNITAALLDYGLPPEKLIVVELLPALASHLRRRFPQLTVIEGDATHLKTLLGPEHQPVSAVVSSLPLRSLPPEIVPGILAQVNEVLHDKGVMVQFTYDLRSKTLPDQNRHFVRVTSKIVWQNFPPARVESFRTRLHHLHPPL
ncbi:class I SAM-dependent methyltransferase [Candidatus Venteria ishoeyi]|uniref:16S ribosomal RNA methyltransferase KsgA/Dim1 family protein n=1 Tax=Candidatus Venteria ishoeyi TaxID=1899563 RepID=A0A1H6FF47_9GAMM|nr:methyltransferase domain-containing protein [Candidatus Venteria ishoeyi]MDM8545733.1 methyltransferase domain-containing protein [Candidatus Venteria ishoeyi]SEH07634.1 16S ribosomal RNA methyltransferase KsgA/Dim1 family protein [Candidatus Venteria ishoeyi]